MLNSPPRCASAHRPTSDDPPASSGWTPARALSPVRHQGTGARFCPAGARHPL